MRKFTAEEYKTAGLKIGEGAGQWAYYSAERDDFHAEEARKEILCFIAEEGNEE